MIVGVLRLQPSLSESENRVGVGAQKLVDSQPPAQRPAFKIPVLYRTFLLVSLSHGRRNVSELLGGEGYEVVEEV